MKVGTSTIALAISAILTAAAPLAARADGRCGCGIGQG